MKRPSTISALLLSIALASVLMLYISGGTSPTATPASPLEQQREIADLKRQIVGLEQRVNWLSERLTEPQRQKPSQF